MIDDASGWVTSMNPIASELFGVTGLELKGVRLVDLLGTDLTSTDPCGRNTPGHVALPLRGEYEVVVADDAQASRNDRTRSVVMLVPSIGQADGQNCSSRVVGWEEAAERCRALVPDVLCVAIGVVGLPAVNADFSRSTGDFAIAEVHRRLRLAVGEEGMVARIGGIRFLALSPCNGHDQLSVDRFVDAVRRPIVAPLGEVILGCAAGATLGRSRTPLVLFDRAVRNLEHALERGAGSIEWIASSNPHRNTPARLATQLSAAVVKSEIGAVFQPVVSMLTGEIVEYEAFARWSEHGEVGPMSMIDLAEDIGIMDELRASVLSSAVAVLQRCRVNQSGGLRRVSINVCSSELTSSSFVETISSFCEDAGISPSCLRLEITDAVPRDQLTSISHTVDTLRARGIRVALDGLQDGAVDWLSLITLDVDAIKVEAHLLACGQHNGRATAALRSLLDLASELGIEVIVKGVETVDQHDQLVSAGCHLAQGWLYGRPRGADDVDPTVVHTVQSTMDRTMAGARLLATALALGRQGNRSRPPCAPSPCHSDQPGLADMLAKFRSCIAANMPIETSTADAGEPCHALTGEVQTERALR
jgi:predicted signal transduction protein with EAL and GGDEF domain